jgi:hypothetical protein
MAKTFVKFSKDVEGGRKMAISVKEAAKGNTGNTAGPVKTPAPDAISAPRSGSGQGYGANGPVGNASSVAPGKRVVSTLAQNLEQSSDDGEGVLQTVIERGARMDDTNFQTRVISDKGYPAAHGMRSRTSDYGSPGGTVPAKTDAASAAVPGYGKPVRKPGA